MKIAASTSTRVRWGLCYQRQKLVEDFAHVLSGISSTPLPMTPGVGPRTPAGVCKPAAVLPEHRVSSPEQQGAKCRWGLKQCFGWNAEGGGLATSKEWRVRRILHLDLGVCTSQLVVYGLEDQAAFLQGQLLILGESLDPNTWECCSHRCYRPCLTSHVQDRVRQKWKFPQAQLQRCILTTRLAKGIFLGTSSLRSTDCHQIRHGGTWKR